MKIACEMTVAERDALREYVSELEADLEKAVAQRNAVIDEFTNYRFTNYRNEREPLYRRRTEEAEAKYYALLAATNRLLSSHCDDCGLYTDALIVKGDHHGGWKVVCRDRDACNRRAPP